MEKKIQATALGAMIAVVSIWLLSFYQPELMAEAPIGLEAALTGGFSVFCGWLIPNERKL